MLRDASLGVHPSKIFEEENNPLSLSPFNGGKELEEPLSKDELTTREHIILLKGSKMHGFVFPPWSSAPDGSEFVLHDRKTRFVDDIELALSDEQSEIFNGWRRPDEILASPSLKTPENETAKSTMLDLVQDFTADCSVVAGLCAATARTERGHPDVFASVIYPYDRENTRSAISSNGKCIFRFHVNGCYRKVITDDRLPTSRNDQSLFVVDRGNRKVFWPALIEKAYLKVRGGYDFPGSNSGTDLWVLTGWFPEQIFLQSDDIVGETLWRRMYNSFSYGDVIITLGTGKLTQNEEAGLGLAGEHDYAVIDVKQIGDQHLFLVKNPWSKGLSWKGHVRIEKGTKDNTSKPHSNDARSGSVLDKPEMKPLAPGTFWMSLNDVFNSFESIYLNWNPGLFSHRKDVHFDWDLSLPRVKSSFASNPQYEVRSQIGGVVWILLCRHFISALPDGRMNDRSTVIVNQGFISLYAFENDGKRVFMRDGVVAQGPYIDSPNTLLKLDLPAKKAYTIVISEQAIPRSRNAFTLSVLSLASASLTPAQDKYSHSNLQRGAWTPSTSGGTAGSPSYHLNPQFKIRVPTASDISLLLENPTNQFPVHVNLIWANGNQVHSITTRDVVGDSGGYRKGCAWAEIRDVQAGIYTIVCSTFERGQFGGFVLHVHSMVACHIDRVQTAAAGRFISTAKIAVFKPGNERLLAPLMTRRLNRLFMAAKSRGYNAASGSAARSPLRVAIELGQGASRQLLTASGEGKFVDSSNSAVRTTDIDIHPAVCEGKGLWAILERLPGSVNQKVEAVDLELFSEEPISIGSWAVGDTQW